MAAPAPARDASPRASGPAGSGRARDVILRRLRISKIPAGARVEVRCKGKRCPFKKRRFAVRKGKVNATKAVRKGRLRARAKVQVRITKAGAIGMVVIYRVHRRGLPKGKVRCLPPGASAPRRC